MNSEEFRSAAHRLVDWIADYRAHVEEFPVRSEAPPGWVRERMPSAPPAEPETIDAIFRDIDALLVPALTHWQHPRFFGYFPSNGDLSSVLGDFLSTGLGVIGLSWAAAPALTEVETVVCDWLRQMLGLSSAWSGVIQDTASTSSLVALICTRERSSDFALARGGLQEPHAPLVVYVAAHSHSSVEKAALMAGFGREHVRRVAHDEHYAMCPQSLRAAIREDLAAGRVPCAVVATVGTTATTAIDPLEAIATLCVEQKIWLHVDAALAGSAMILPECRPLWHGIEGADSLVLNPHKWLGVAFDCSTYYVRDPQHLVRVLGTNPSYLQSAADSQVQNYRDWGLPLGRRFRALKLWWLIRHQGVQGLQARLRRDLENARWLERQLRSTPPWRVLAPVPLQTLCARHEPPGLTGEALDQHTLRWCEQLNASGRAYLTPAQLDGRWMVRISVGALLTERRHVEELWSALQQLTS